MTYFYTGEVDQDGKACGYGSAYNQVDSDWEVEGEECPYPQETYEGTLFNDKPHGICKSLFKILSAFLTSFFYRD